MTINDRSDECSSSSENQGEVPAGVEFDIHGNIIDNNKYIYGPVMETFYDAHTGEEIGEQQVGWEPIGDK
ncbi:MAG: hypothetical protein ACFFCS_21475 [Candidatus Hodarchaeota archaeon]